MSETGGVKKRGSKGEKELGLEGVKKSEKGTREKINKQEKSWRKLQRGIEGNRKWTQEGKILKAG